MKTCNKCKEEKEYREFHKNKSNKDGYHYICKECRKIESSKYYDKNRSILIDKINNYRKHNKGYLETNKRYKENNPEKIKHLKKKWSRSEKCKELNRKYYQENKETIKKRVKINRENNIDYYLMKDKERRDNRTKEEKRILYEYQKEWAMKHREEYPHIYTWRSLLRNVLLRMGTEKDNSTLEMLGYSSLDLKLHMESLFREGMSWDNHGEWHIDHIKPVSLFDPETDVSIVNSLDNLQPLWAYENLSKGNKYKE